MANSTKEAQAWTLEHLRITSSLQSASAICGLGDQERRKIDKQFSRPKLFRFGLGLAQKCGTQTFSHSNPLSFEACLHAFAALVSA